MRSAPVLATAVALLASFGSSSLVDAQAKKKAGGKAPQACGAKVLPLAVGNQWTYSNVPALAPAPPNIAKLAPEAPKQVVVTVTNIETKDGDTVVTLEEKHSFDTSKDSGKANLVEHTVTSTITCNAKGKFDISPEAFFFNAEPGGYHGITFDSFTRKKETSWKLTKGTIGDAEWIEEIVAVFKRPPTKNAKVALPGGKLEIERRIVPQPQEQVNTKLGTYTAEKLGITTTGRVLLDERKAPDKKPCVSTSYKPDPKDPTKQITVQTPIEHCELPADWISTIWLAEGIGVVQTLNSYAHMYQLVDAQLK